MKNLSKNTVQKFLFVTDLDYTLIGDDETLVSRDAHPVVRLPGPDWEMPATATVVCGDSGNDIGLFNVPEARGIIVGNAPPELRQWYEQQGADYHYQAKAACAGGILEGLRYFGLLK